MELINTFDFAGYKLGKDFFAWILDLSFAFVDAFVDSFTGSLILAFLSLIVLNLFLEFDLIKFKIYHPIFE